jgi:8-oxo-dGTP pyrophosphatase MutT (NUDIX family)
MIIEKSAGGLVYKKEKGELVWLIRRPTPNPNYRGNLGWSFPKGMIDPGESVEQAAIREVKEEGGVNAAVVSKLPTLKIFFVNNLKEKVMKFVTYFVMEYKKNTLEGHDWETEETKWVSIEEAKILLTHKNEIKLVLEASDRMAQ